MTLLLWCFGTAAAITAIYWTCWYIITMIRVNKIPGPPTLPLIGNVLDICIPSGNKRQSDFLAFRDKLWNLLRRLAKEYYPVYRLWSGPLCAVALLCPEDIELLMATPKHSSKSPLYYLLEPWLGKGLLTSAGAKWQNRRKILTPAFHFSILQQFLPIFTEQSELLVDELRKECDRPDTQIVPIITKFTLHSICETAMGTQLHEEKEQQKLYKTSIYKVGELVVHRVLRPWIHLPPVYIFAPQFWQMRKVTRLLHDFSNAIIRKRKSTFKDRDFSQVDADDVYGKKRLAMLDLLISAQKAGADIDDEGIREEVDTFMFEGHDTTAMSICFTLMLLANHQDIQDRVVAEIREIFGDSDRLATYQDLQNMNYLEMVLKESLRMYPSVPLIARWTDEDIHTQSGYVVPAWCFVHIYIYDIHHDPKLYPEPEKFDPDRFLPENTQKRHPFSYIPFSAGPRNCIGQRFAMLELKTAISSILRRFVLEPVDTPADIVLMMDLIIRPKNGIKIKFRPRCS